MVFEWRFLLEKLSTHLNLLRRNIIRNLQWVACVLYFKENEDLDDYLFSMC